MKTMIRKRLCVLLSTLLAAPMAHSEDLLEIYNLALQQDPVLGEVRARYEVDHAALAQSRARLLPSMVAQASTSRNANGPENTFSYADSSNANGYLVNIQQVVLNFQEWFNWQSARANDQRASAALMRGEQEMIMRVARAYFDVLRSQESQAFYAAQAEAAQTRLQTAQRRLEVGLGAITDVNAAQAEYDRVQVERLNDQRLLNQRRLALEVITNGSHERLDGLRDEFPIAPVDPASPEAWVQLASDNSPEVQEARFTHEASSEAARAARSALLPTISASATYRWNAATENPFAVRANEAQIGASVGLNFTMPIFVGGGNRARMRQAYYQRNFTEQSMVRVERENERRTRDSYLGVEIDVQAVQAGRQAVLSAQTALDSAQTGLEVGIRNALDLANAQRDLYSALRNLAEARYNYVIDTLTLKQAAGVLTPEDIRALNEWLQ
jgi:outer membrane protein